MTSKTPARGYVEAWDVESLSDSSKVYTVSRRANGTYACSCPSWKFAKSPKPNCKHIRALHAEVTARPVNVPVSVPVTVRMITVMFDGALVARLTEAEAERLRAMMPGIRVPEAAPVVTAEFRIRRKFKFEE